MSKSIISNEKVCLICDTPLNIHKHHIFEGTANRKKSEEQGCWCYLCERHHNMSNEAVHFNYPFDITLKKFCQRIWEREKGTREDFIKIFGKSWM